MADFAPRRAADAVATRPTSSLKPTRVGGDPVADIQRRVTQSGAVRWDVRYRDDARQQRKKSFERKVDAQRFANSVETDILRGDWIDPRRAQEP